MKSKSSNFFWPSYTDLMTSLFFIMLVLYVLTFVRLQKSKIELIQKNKELEHKLAVYELVEQNLRPLKKDSNFFIYEADYKRYKLSFDVQFKTGLNNLDAEDLDNYDATINNIDQAGRKLKAVVDDLQRNKIRDTALKNVSYLLIISGYASKLANIDQDRDYIRLSYTRAYNLWQHWKSIGIDFEDPKYDGLIDLQIAGNGWGGVGRIPRDFPTFENEKKNQRFIIQIIPKIGEIK